jgi:hypothetical protein
LTRRYRGIGALIIELISRVSKLTKSSKGPFKVQYAIIAF